MEKARRRPPVAAVRVRPERLKSMRDLSLSCSRGAGPSSTNSRVGLARSVQTQNGRPSGRPFHFLPSTRKSLIEPWLFLLAFLGRHFLHCFLRRGFFRGFLRC